MLLRRLEAEAKAQAEGALDETVATGIGRSRNLKHSARESTSRIGPKPRNVAGRIAELRRVGNVHCLCPELHVDPFRDPELAEESHIDVGDTGAPQVVDSPCTEAGSVAPATAPKVLGS